MSQSTNIIGDDLLNALGDVSGKKILDVGCGKGRWECVIRAENESNNSNPVWIEGIEIFEPYIDYARKHGCINEIHRLDLEESLLPFLNKSFDIVICTEVLEHLSKDRGKMLLMEMDRVAKEKIIISTPGNWITHYAVDGNEHQKHKSLWKPKDFESLGYKVDGLGFNGDFLPHFLKQKVCVVFAWVGHFWKSQCDTIFAVKTL